MPGLDLYWQAFFDLCTCRVQGWSDGPIPWTAIDRYATACGFDGDQREDLFEYVRTMDREFLAWKRRKDESKRKER